MEKWWQKGVGRAFRYDYMNMILTIDRLVREFRPNDLARFTGLPFEECTDVILSDSANPVTQILIAVARDYPGVEAAYR